MKARKAGTAKEMSAAFVGTQISSLVMVFGTAWVTDLLRAIILELETDPTGVGYPK